MPTCPHCDNEIQFHPIADIPDDFRIVFVIEPEKGHVLRARTVGETITNFEKLYKSVSKEMGAKLDLFIEKLETDENGKISVHFLGLNKK